MKSNTSKNTRPAAAGASAAGQVFGRGALERELASKQRTGQVERVEARLSAQ